MTATTIATATEPGLPGDGANHAPDSTVGWFRPAALRPANLAAGGAVAVVCAAWAFNTIAPTGLNSGVVTTGALMTASLFAYIVSGSVGAWRGVAERRTGLDELAGTSTGAWRRDRLLAVSAVASATVLGYLVAVAFIAGWTLSQPYRAGAIETTAIAVEALTIAAHAPVGYLIGRQIPTRIAPVFVAVLTLLVDSTLGSSYGTPASLLVPGNSVDPSAFVTWNGHVFIAQCLWFAGVFGVLLVISAGRTDHLRRALLAGGLAACLAVAGALALAPYDGKRFAPNVVVGVAAGQERCAGGDPEVCVPPAYLGVQASLARGFHVLMTKVDGTPAWTPRLELRPRGIGQRPTAGARAIHTDVATDAAASLSLDEYIEDLLGDQCWGPDAALALPWEQVVRDWLAGASSATTGATDAAAAREWFAGLDPTAQNLWFRAHYDDFVTCRLTAQDFR